MTLRDRTERGSTPRDPTARSGSYSKGSEIAESRLLSFLERLLPEQRPDASEAERRQSRILVGLGLTFLAIAVSTVLVHALYGTTDGVIAGVAIGVCGAGLLGAVRAGVPAEPLGHVMMWVIYALSVGTAVASGGGTVVAIFSASFIPLFAAILDKPVNVTRWTVAVLAGVGVGALYASATDSYLFDSTISKWHEFRFVIMAVTLLLVYSGTLILDWARGRALEEVRSSRAELNTQSERYRSLVENVGDVIMEYDDKGRCVYVSPNCYDVSGRTSIEMMGYGFQDHILPDDLLRIGQVTNELRHQVGVTRRLTVRIRHFAGRWTYGQMSARSFLAENGSVHFVTIFRDVTELRRSELQIRHSERLATAGTLAAGIAHQINNPIGSIRNASELALMCARDGDLAGIEAVLEGNIEQATRCGEIVRSLLQFASREAPSMTRHDLVEIVRGVREFTKSYARERAIEIAFESPARPVMVNVSAIEIEQVIVNLIRNAIESSPDSKLVSVTVSRRGAVASCVVRDDGCGISELDRAHVFDPFFTTRIRDGGSGLGLSVAHGIVRDHGGTMTLDSAPGKGTTVTVELPISPEPVPS